MEKYSLLYQTEQVPEKQKAKQKFIGCVTFTQAPAAPGLYGVRRMHSFLSQLVQVSVLLN